MKQEYLPLKKVDQRKLRDVTKKMSAVVRHIETDDVTQTNQTCFGSIPLSCKRSWSEERQKRREKEPWWKRIEIDITNLTRDIKRLKRERQGETGGKGNRITKELNAKYKVKKKEINLVVEELKQMLIAKKMKVKRYQQRISQFS